MQAEQSMTLQMNKAELVAFQKSGEFLDCSEDMNFQDQH